MVCLFVCLSVLEREIQRERQKREGHKVWFVEMWGGREVLEGIEGRETVIRIYWVKKCILKSEKKTGKVDCYDEQNKNQKEFM